MNSFAEVNESYTLAEGIAKYVDAIKLIDSFNQ